MLKCKQLLDYLATHPDATVRFHSSEMILNIHSDASYLSETNTHSRACGHFMGWKPDAKKPIKSDASYLSETNTHSRACGHFMGWKPGAKKPIKLNGTFFTLCAILRYVVASAAEAELGALFLNCKQAAIFRVRLEELGHPHRQHQSIATTLRPSA